MLASIVAVIGPPAAGKTTLTMQLGQLPGRRVFRLREHVPQPILAATATDAERLGWIDNFTVITSAHEYVEGVVRDGTVHTLLLDNFPGTGTQVSLFLSVLRQLAPACAVSAIELVADPLILHRRAAVRRVCQYCERDPLCDPRLPAEASPTDFQRCARCNHLLEMRRSDEPTVYAARMQRYQAAAEGIRRAFATAGISIDRLDSSRPIEHTSRELAALLTPKEHLLMTAVSLPAPQLRGTSDGYGHARMPRGVTVPEPERIDRVAYGRFRNVYLYITEACQLRCEHCYMGERLDRALKMPLPQIIDTLATWRRLGGSKLTILGGEPTLHPDYCATIRAAGQIGYEHVITTTNAQAPALRKFCQLEPRDFAYVQVSLDGGSASSHDRIRGDGTFGTALATVAELSKRGFDTRIICTVNQANRRDVLSLLGIADELGVSLVKFHVFSTIGTGHGNPELAMTPPEWVGFCDHLNEIAPGYQTRVWYQPTYARRDQMARYQAEGYQGCIGRTLDRISVFPDGRCYVCSYLFDTDLYFAQMDGDRVRLNHGENEFELFTRTLVASSCSGCKATACLGGCPAEQIVMGASSCDTYEDIVPVCRLWKSSAKPGD